MPGSSNSLPGSLVPAVTFTLARGEYYYPTKSFNGFLWCVDADGAVSRISPLGGGKPRPWSNIASGSVGFNNFEIVNVSDTDLPFRGPVLIAADQFAIHAVSLITRETAILFEAEKSQIHSNTNAGEASHFRGVAATDSMYCFLVRSQDSATLNVRYFLKERTPESPLNIGGAAFLSPFIYQDTEAGLDYVGVCSNEQVCIYDLREQVKQLISLPLGFEPFFSRPALINIPQGSSAFAIGPGLRGWEGWIGGMQNDRPGILRLEFESGKTGFTALPKGAALGSASGSGMWVNQLDSINFHGVNRNPVRTTRLQKGMPIGCGSQSFAYFKATDFPANHSVNVTGRNPFQFTFSDAACNDTTCCSIDFVGQYIVIAYVNHGVSEPERGIKIAHWHSSLNERRY